jgi:hypothetical protein
MPFPLSRSLAYIIWPAAYGFILSVKQLAYMPETFYLEQTLKILFKTGQCFLLFKRIINLYVLPLMRIKLSKMITRMHINIFTQPVQNKVVVKT